MLLNLPPKVKSLGQKAEDFALDLLKSKGYKIVTRNFRSRFGEIDIIALDGDSLVFVEVKARMSTKFGAPEESVTHSKLNKIIKTGQYFSLSHPSLPKKLRIDVVALNMAGGTILSSRIITVVE